MPDLKQLADYAGTWEAADAAVHDKLGRPLSDATDETLENLARFVQRERIRALRGEAVVSHRLCAWATLTILAYQPSRLAWLEPLRAQQFARHACVLDEDVHGRVTRDLTRNAGLLPGDATLRRILAAIAAEIPSGSVVERLRVPIAGLAVVSSETVATELGVPSEDVRARFGGERAMLRELGQVASASCIAWARERLDPARAQRDWADAMREHPDEWRDARAVLVRSTLCATPPLLPLWDAMVHELAGALSTSQDRARKLVAGELRRALKPLPRPAAERLRHVVAEWSQS